MASKKYIKPGVLVHQDFSRASSRSATLAGFSDGVDASAFLAAFARGGEFETTKTTDIYELFTHISGGESMGASAYEVWLGQGNTGSVQEFLDSLKGDDGRSAYEIWLELGNVGDEAAFIQSLIGEEGKSAYEIWLEQGNAGTPEEFLGWLQSGRLFWLSVDNQVDITVMHNLGRYPTVYALDNDKNEISVQVKHVSENELQIKANSPITGWVFCQ